MVRVFVSTVMGVLLGVGLGLAYGWVINPVKFTDSPMSELASHYTDDYILMIASGYQVDGNIDAAISRLRYLGVDNIPVHVQEVTERYITNSRNVEDIRLLVALSEGLGRLTPPMETFRQLNSTGGG